MSGAVAGCVMAVMFADKKSVEIDPGMPLTARLDAKVWLNQGLTWPILSHHANRKRRQRTRADLPQRLHRLRLRERLVESPQRLVRSPQRLVKSPQRL